MTSPLHSRRTAAAVLVQTGQPLEIADLEMPALQPGQVLVEMAFSAVCHTQLLETRGYRGSDPFLPHCLGHEGSGTVREISSGVAKVREGDRVILSWMKGSGANIPGVGYGWNGRTVNAGAITTFSRFTIVSENRLTVLLAALSLRQAAVLGCALPTGVGSVLNVAKPRPGQSLAVLGAGGVGLCALAAARIAQCRPLIVVDINDSRRCTALALGADYAFDGSRPDWQDEVSKVCPQGLDFAIEASGRTSVMAGGLQAVRSQGGTLVVVGNARQGEMLQIDPRQLNQGKRILGTWGGDNVPDRDFPRYCDWIAAGHLSVDFLLGREYGLAQVNQALEDLETGQELRPILDLSR